MKIYYSWIESIFLFFSSFFTCKKLKLHVISITQYYSSSPHVIILTHSYIYISTCIHEIFNEFYLLNHILIFTHDLSINFQLLQVVYTVISCFDIFQIHKKKNILQSRKISNEIHLLSNFIALIVKYIFFFNLRIRRKRETFWMHDLVLHILILFFIFFILLPRLVCIYVAERSFNQSNVFILWSWS